MQQEFRHLSLVWLGLLALLALTAGSAYLRLGMWNSIINLGIALAKAVLVGVFFMHARTARSAIRACIGVALFTLALLFAVSASDYATRAMHPAQWQVPVRSDGQ